MAISLTIHEDALPSWRRISAQNRLVPITQLKTDFPALLKWNVSGLEEHKLYQVSLKFGVMDQFKYRLRNKLFHSDSFDPDNRTHNFIHPDEIKTGREWMTTSIAFEKISISTVDWGDTRTATLSDLHRYAPVITIFEYTPLVGMKELGHLMISSQQFYVMENVPNFMKTFMLRQELIFPSITLPPHNIALMTSNWKEQYKLTGNNGDSKTCAGNGKRRGRKNPNPTKILQ